jgi:hypothetical protein
MIEELWHASLAVGALTVLVTVLCLTLTDLPLASILFGEAIGAPTGIAVLTLTSPRRRRR